MVIWLDKLVLQWTILILNIKKFFTMYYVSYIILDDIALLQLLYCISFEVKRNPCIVSKRRIEYLILIFCNLKGIPCHVSPCESKKLRFLSI